MRNEVRIGDDDLHECVHHRTPAVDRVGRDRPPAGGEPGGSVEDMGDSSALRCVGEIHVPILQALYKFVNGLQRDSRIDARHARDTPP